MENDLLRALYEKYYTRALLYTLSLSKDRHLAEDIVADTFLKAYLTLPDAGEGFHFWLFRVCRNLYIDHLRKESRLTTEENAPEASLPSAEDEFLSSERTRALVEAMGALPPTDRELLSLYYFSGLDMGKIARLTGRTPAAVKMALSRARVRLRKLMEDEYEI